MRLVTITLLFLIAGCGRSQDVIQKRIMPRNNPTMYEFNASFEKVKHAIDEARGNDWQDAQKPNEGGVLVWKKDANPFVENFFSNSTNENDAFLLSMGNAVGKSPIYMKDGKALIYFADFHIHITVVNSVRTKVEIFTNDSHVQAGTELLPFARAGIFLQVDPTSIEEYQILLDIGKQLSAENMPHLLLPDSGCPIQEVKEKRRR